MAASGVERCRTTLGDTVDATLRQGVTQMSGCSGVRRR